MFPGLHASEQVNEAIRNLHNELTNVSQERKDAYSQHADEMYIRLTEATYVMEARSTAPASSVVKPPL